MSVRRLTLSAVIVLILISVVIATGCIVPGFGPPISGSGVLETREYDYANFTRIEVGSTFEVTIESSSDYNLSITADDNIFEFINVTQNAGTLRIGLEPGRSYVSTTQKAVITLPSLFGLKLYGASAAVVTGFNSSDDLSVEVSGASNLNINETLVTNTQFEVSGASHVFGNLEMTAGNFVISGASSVELTGSAQDILLEASGASNARLSGLPCTDISFNISGASRATVNASSSLSGSLSGASQLTYLGSPTLGAIDITGGSKMTTG